MTKKKWSYVVEGQAGEGFAVRGRSCRRDGMIGGADCGAVGRGHGRYDEDFRKEMEGK